ncbi:MAG: RNA polymerase-binding protein DksA [Gammaproteobacteria bacterium]|nr:RNA polymerase-binding protein DksA [Gammaproteobacteria bacterium]
MSKKLAQETSTAHVVGLPGIAPYQAKKNEKYMNEGQQQHFRAILIAIKQQLMEGSDATVESLRGDDKELADPADKATREEIIGLMLRASDREGKLLRKTEEALQRLDDGEYGYCESCGEEIGIKRLEARPTATLCIDCKTLDEIREKQRGN